MRSARLTARAARASLAALALSAASGAAAAPREDQVLILGNPQGAQTVAAQADGTVRGEFSFNDRGRGDHITATWKLDDAGVPIDYQGSGNDYFKVPLTESFHLANGKASWQNRAEHGATSVHGAAFYVPENAPPEFLGVLARALLKAPQHRLALLPAGEAQLESVGPLRAAADGVTFQQYQLSGLDFAPTAVWLERDGSTAAVINGWMAVLAPRARNLVQPLTQAQTQFAVSWSEHLAETQTHVPAGEVLIRNARLFDPRDLSVTGAMSVLVHGERIVRVAADADLSAPAGAELIEAHGRFLMPGLWDNHQHFRDNDGALDLAAGVTSARDMANDTEDFPKRVARFEAGRELGPRVWKAGIIDGDGPFAGPTQMRIKNAADALKDVSWYADHGYGQIKIYSSVPPELVPVIADAAHARGLRVSGHVPAYMTAQQFVAAGADEIQHINFLVLNFLFAQVQDTRSMSRFTAVAAHARELPPEQPQVRDFIAYLSRHHTVLDPTVNVFDAMFCGDPAAITPGLEQIAPRLPAQIRRGLLSGALAMPAGEEDAYRAALPALLSLLKALHEAGVTIIPGTDSMAGYGLQHELELYERAGIAPREVLRMATLTSAQVIGADGERGVIAPGRLADLILVNGDPDTHVAELRKVELVMKGGRIYQPENIERALGIAPRT
jgi:imidazolonepropionase-like amidohydrolase